MSDAEMVEEALYTVANNIQANRPELAEVLRDVADYILMRRMQ